MSASICRSAILWGLLGTCVWGVSPTERMFPAFPGAEGAGAYTAGGRGGKVFLVTTLEDYHRGRERPIPGSLRAAIEGTGPRTILFRVAGIIDLKRPLVIEHPQITIAGQSAPGGGITLQRYPIEIKASDVIIRYLRVRPGDLAGKEMDGISCSAQRVILDHCSVSWSIDETLSTNGDSHDVTVQWCFITESLNRSKHHKGAHGYGSLISGPGEISYHHNLYAFHNSRNPRPGDVLLDFRNNLIVGWGIRPGYNRDNTTRMNYIGNTLEPFAYSKLADAAFHTENVPEDSRMRFFLAGNEHRGNPAGTEQNWLLIAPPRGKTREQIAFIQAKREFPTCTVRTETASVARERILQEAGAILPLRDGIDARIVKQIASKQGTLIDSQDQIGGWVPMLPSEPESDTNQDGLPDPWIARHQFVGTQGAQNADPDQDGYTNLEEYLNRTHPLQPDRWLDPPSVTLSQGTNFAEPQTVTLRTTTPEGELRYTTDESEPSLQSPRYTAPFPIDRSVVLRTRTFLKGESSHVRNVELIRHLPLAGVNNSQPQPGLKYEYFEEPQWKGEGWEHLVPKRTGVCPTISVAPREGREAQFGLRFRGFLHVPETGLYTFWLRCSPRGELRIGSGGDWLLESQSRRRENSRKLALQAGNHPLEFRIFYSSDVDKTLEIDWSGPGIPRQPIPASQLKHAD